MSIDLKQFAGASVTPADDARLYNFLLSGKTGIVEGVEITHLGANQLKISSGWGVCCGRVFTVSEETVNAAVSASGEVKGRLLINIDVSADVPATFVTQAAADLPQLVQEDINSSGTVYQISLAEYTVDALALSNVVKTAVVLPYSEGTVIYTQQEKVLTGSGANGKFKATASGIYTAFTIAGVSYAVKAGSETEIELTSGVWYSFILDTEAKTINFKAGGAGLNFKIVGGTSQPTSPKENTIWIKTSTAIKEWQFSATQPTKRPDGSALQNGDVWISTRNYAGVNFNALKKNGLQVQMSACEQYNGTNWESKPIKIYTDSKWQDIDLIIFDGETIKNGYSFTTLDFYNGNVKGTPIIKNGKVDSNVSYTYPALELHPKIDLTDRTTITAEISFSRTFGSGGSGMFYIINQTGVKIDNYAKAKVALSNKGAAIEKITLDVTSVTGEYYMGVSVYSPNASLNIYIHSLEIY